MKLESLQKLFLMGLKDVYSAETQATQAMPKMMEAASNQELKKAFELHINQTKEQVNRLEKIFKSLNENPKGHPCKAMQGLVEEAEEIINASGEADVKDAGLIAAAQKVEHYEIAAYGSLRTYASMLDNDEAVRLLEETLNEEKETDQILNQLAENTVNVKAQKKG
jgi:ferritin-like metal-binding protein YciE